MCGINSHSRLEAATIGREALRTPAQIRRALKQNAERRSSVHTELERARQALRALVVEAKGAKIPMTEVAQLAGVERRVLYDLLKHDRSPRLGAGAERSTR